MIHKLSKNAPQNIPKGLGRFPLLFFFFLSFLVKLQRRHRDMVKKGQKLKKGSFFPIKTLTLEMAPNDMLQETRKKN